MLARLYAFLFVLLLVMALWYQRAYLRQISVNLDQQLIAQKSIMQVVFAKIVNSYSFTNGVRSSSFQSNTLVYFTDKHFEADENIVYTQFDKETLNPQINIITDKAYGQIIDDKTDDTSDFSSVKDLKYAILPHLVQFNLQGNKGTTSDVYIDGIQKTLSSKNNINSQRAQGSINSNGFFYSIPDESFKLYSNVSGKIILPQAKKQVIKTP